MPRSISVPRAARNQDVAAIVLRIDTDGASGAVRLTPRRPAAFRDGRGEAVWRARAGRLRVAAHVEIARTGLLYRELAALVVGDAVVFDGVACGCVRGARVVAGAASSRRHSRRRSR